MAHFGVAGRFVPSVVLRRCYFHDAHAGLLSVRLTNIVASVATRWYAMRDHWIAAGVTALNLIVYSLLILLLGGCTGARVATPAQPEAYQACQPPPGAVVVVCK